MKKSLPIFLIASLCLNAALIGGIAAGVWKLASDQREMPRREAHGERPHGPGPGAQSWNHMNCGLLESHGSRIAGII